MKTEKWILLGLSFFFAWGHAEKTEKVLGIDPIPVKSFFEAQAQTTFEVVSDLGLNIPIAYKDSLFRSAGTERLWKEREGLESNFIFPKSQEAQWSLLAFSVDNTEFQKYKLEIQSRKPFIVYLDGKVFFEKKTNETDDEKLLSTSANINMEPGQHHILIKSFYPGRQAEWALKILSSLNVLTDNEQKISLPDQLFQDEYGKLQITRDAKRIAYLRNHIDPTEHKHKSTFYIEDMENYSQIASIENLKDLSMNSKGDVLYIKKQGKNFAVFLKNAKDNKEAKIYESSENIHSLLWSPDNTYFLFAKTLKNQEKNPHGLKYIAELAQRWNISSQKVVPYFFDMKSQKAYPLGFDFPNLNFCDISKDSRYILVSSVENTDNKSPYVRTNFYQIDWQASNTQKTHSIDGLAEALYFPDTSRWIICAQGQNNPYDKQLYLWNTQSKKSEKITQDFKPAIDKMKTNYAKNRLWFTASDQDRIQIFSYDSEKKVFKKYATQTEVIKNFALAQNEAILYNGSSIKESEAVFYQKMPKSSFQKICSTENPKMYHVKLGEVENWVFSNDYQNSLSAMFYLPPDFTDTKKYPLIVYYYGGVHPSLRSFDNRYPKHVWAACGYVVLVLQTSGAIGYGEDFSGRHKKDWGERTTQEIIRGVQEFYRRFDFVDSSKIACIGGSYGGFLSEYILCKTSLFKAAVSHAGISAPASYWGGGYWGYLYGLAAFGDTYPWSEPDFFTERSPLFSADKINTPLLLLHGTEDKNVPLQESYQLYTALKVLGKEVALVEIQGADHIVKDPLQSLEREKFILAWFEKHLKGKDLWWKTLTNAQ